MSRVSVVRQPYTLRDSEAGRLSGVVKAWIETLSYIHVSSGRERLELIERPTAMDRQIAAIEDKLVRGDYRGLEDLVLRVRIGYVDNVTYGDKVCIPGSTIKGLLRSRLELCPSREGRSISCIQTALPPITAPIPSGQHGWRHVRIWSQSVAEDRGAPCNPIATQDYSLCKTCDLFGAPGIIGRIAPSNFCCDGAQCEPRDLPYGEKVYAIKPRTRLDGVIHFLALTVEELGILFIAMGLVKGSTTGVPILVGKHKYAYRDMGVARFVIEFIEFPLRFRDLLELIGIEFTVEEYKLVCRGEALRKLVGLAIDRALESYPQLEKLHGFSEAEERNKVIS